ncbi:hypothetical protein DACRYDRAFT_25057 [Dacryopinax primogenitus]|uniref:Nucleic acid-binding protein n=1 Tax=Dacryopinax primogenitus (strain DJM 731) TaxID=1858805 RepID=M5FQH0_DACPD|nr:uncharacterized protein DACRYDRAFT_25057 [Dacryopinax primogenitus]EJT97708.1 hypothetical protein DACRYDRAFT_25057 [Dacryopinax primogenitus]
MNALRTAVRQQARRMFSTTPSRSTDISKLILVGRLGAEPQVKLTRNEKEYVSYVVATTNYPGPLGEDGVRPEPTTSWHRVLSFNPNQNEYLKNLQKGSQVYVEANYETREPQADAEPGTPAAQRQIFLRHETLRVLSRPRPAES